MNPALQGYAAAVLEEAGADTGRLADELAAVERLTTDHPDLRAALSDTGVAPASRRAVLDDLLQGRVDDRVRRAAGFAAAAVPAPQVGSALAWLSYRARRAADEPDAPEPMLGHLEARRRVGGYAQAVFEETGTEDLEEVEDELFRFSRIVATAPALRTALSDRDLPQTERLGIVHDLLAGRARPATARLAAYAVRGGRPRDLSGTLSWLVEEVARARGWRVAQVQAGREVDEAERRQLAETLGRMAGAPVELQLEVDPELLAGVRIRIGDVLLDATVRDRLDRLRQHVTAGAWDAAGGGSTVGGDD
jgi:F-type H+-transporting ATPase subunit delta